MNLFLHGMEDFDIVRGDTLRTAKFLQNDKLETFDCVITNPLLSLKEWGYDKCSSDPFGRNTFGLAPKANGDFAWAKHLFAGLKPETGRMTLVLHHGVLFRGGAEGRIRQALLEHGHIVTTIGLASNLFHDTRIPTCILILQTKAEPKEPVFIINAKEIFAKGRAQNTLTSEQADEIYVIYKHQLEDYSHEKEGLTRWAPYSELEENDFNLNIARYVQKPLEDDTVAVKEVLAGFQEKLVALEQAEEELEELLIKESFEV